MEVNFLLPHFGLEPTGGFKIAYYYANYLSQKGYNVNIIHTASLKNNIKKYPKYIIAHFNKIKCKQRWFEFDKNINLMYVPMINDSTIPNADITVATAWQTAELLEGLNLSKGKKIYLIQHYEIWNGKKEDVDRTWQYSDMNKIVISKWLMEIADKMQINKYTYIPNSLDHNKFILNQQVEKREKVISMMYSDVEWKGSIDGIEAFENIKKEINDISVKIFGKCKRPDNLPMWIKYYENPSQDILVNEIYNKSSIFYVLVGMKDGGCLRWKQWLADVL
ncbi:hypothetical protein [Clostridium beijerinckii]|uniref:hypothetical protein n=1 Tax=Clostridium beijerinckii TaxID=1520 RepID=UPI0015705F37|nr:hypothetical protein [Clostridium beijerinckii]NRV83717.1 glycosyltransferase involved in cell wall biosynthesis [Clostridium beijerinckii]